MLRTLRRTPALIVTQALLLVALTGCGAQSDEPETVVSTTPTQTPTQTAQPTVLAFGDAETVAWAPTAALAGELSITVEKVRTGDFADFDGLDGSGITVANQPFYVEALITNEGDTDLGGLDVPLYLEDSNGTLSPPWGFATPFKPCDSGPFPASFAAGDELETCLVFFGSPGATFESVTFQPSLDTPAVTWTGDPTVGKLPKKKSGKKKR